MRPPCQRLLVSEICRNSADSANSLEQMVSQLIKYLATSKYVIHNTNYGDVPQPSFQRSKNTVWNETVTICMALPSSPIFYGAGTGWGLGTVTEKGRSYFLKTGAGNRTKLKPCLTRGRTWVPAFGKWSRRTVSPRRGNQGTRQRSHSVSQWRPDEGGWERR